MRGWAGGCGVLVAMISVASAEEAPPPPGLTLPAGKLALSLTVEASLSDGAFLEPVSVAPDVAYGITPDLTLALAHSGFATTGFRGNAGSGFCLTGEDGGCPHAYNRVGVEAHYGLLRGPLSLAAVGGLTLWSIDPAWLDVKLGLRVRHVAGAFVATFTPSLFVGLNDRDAGNEDSLWLPVSFGYKPVPALLVALGGGLKLPSLEAAGDSWRVALGLIGQYSLRPNVQIGASFFFGEILAASAVPDAAKGLDRRQLQLWISTTL
jgi:hypothetical protein